MIRPIELRQPPKRILIIKPSAVGDVVHALPILNLLRARWPDARISWLVTPACAGILDGHPQLDELIRFDRKGFGRSWRSPSVLSALLAFAAGLRGRAFDLVIDLQGLFRSGWLAGVTAAPVRVGLGDAREGASVFYTHRVAVGAREQHALERYLCVTEALGIGRSPVRFVFPTDEADRSAVARMTPDRYAVLVPGTNWATKRWPIEHFAALVAPLRDRYGLATVVAGTAGERPLASAIGGAVNLAGQTNLRQLVALLERASVVIANDSGPMHIAAALGRPLVTMFGPTNPIRTGPFDRPDSVIRLDIACSPCYRRHCIHQSCLTWMSPESVIDTAGMHLRQAGVIGRAAAD